MNNDLIARRIRQSSSPAAPPTAGAPQAGLPAAGPPPRWLSAERRTGPWDRRAAAPAEPAEPAAPGPAASADPFVPAPPPYRPDRPPFAHAPAPFQPTPPPFEPAIEPAGAPSSDRPSHQPEFEPDDEFVSYSPPWLAPEDDLWGRPVADQAVRRSADDARAADSPDGELQPVAGEPRPWHEEVVPSAAERPRLIFPDLDPSTIVDATAADPEDALAPIAEDLLLSTPARLTDEPWLERDLATALVIEPEPGPGEEFEAAAPAAPVGEILESEAPPATATVQSSGPLGWSPAPRYSSVFGDLFRQAVPAIEDDVRAHEATETVSPADPLDWPPVPVDLFPPLASALPELNLELESAPDVAIHWPEDPRAQIFWPGAAPAPVEQRAPVEQPVPARDEVPPVAEQPPVLPSATPEEVEPHHDPIYVPRDPRFEPRFTVEDVPASRPVLIFSDPPSAPWPGRESDSVPDARATLDGPVRRLASHASAFAERMPDHWALTAPPTLVLATEEAVARELAEIQSPALTVLFAVVVIAAVLLFVFLVTPLLR